MPHLTPLIGTMVAGLVIAFLFGMAAHRFKLPPIVGYLLAGVIVGPFTPGYVADQQIATELAELGVRIAIDDFGTGYSSLQYLKCFPIHSLKIDRSFVSALHRSEHGGSAAVVRAVLAMARTLGMDVIAEGIETDEQRDCLLELGCELGQGFLFSHARPAKEWARRRH